MSSGVISAHRVEGYVLGLQSASVRVQLRAEPHERSVYDRTSARIVDAFSALDFEDDTSLPEAPTDDHPGAVARWFGAAVDAIQARAGLPFIDATRGVTMGGGDFVLFVPGFDYSTEPVSNLCSLLLLDLSGTLSDDALATRLKDVVVALRATQPSTSNGPRLTRAAFELGIPFRQLPGEMTLYGIGRNGARVESTFTQFTRRNGVAIARRKPLTSLMLRRALLPTPDFKLANDADEAVRIADRFGYPVVVKPADRDGGVAVEAGLANEHDLRTAFDAAYQISKSIMVERHVEGRDYRLTVFRGKMIWAVERRPAGVTGDGQSDIRSLVERLNNEPGRGDDTFARLKRIPLGAEAMSLIEEQHLQLDSIPAEGHFVRLARKSNVTAGGMPVAVTGEVHPDNARLAERAAMQLDLDLAGVDLIVPDIAASWRETGGAICEVNAMPELGGTTSLHLYPKILDELVPNRGRIPSIAIIGDRVASDLAKETAAILDRPEHPCGIHDRDGIRVGKETIERGVFTTKMAGRFLVDERRVASLVWCTIGGDVVASGFPVPRNSALLLTGERPRETNGEPMEMEVLTNLLALLRGIFAQTYIVEKTGDPQVLALIRRLYPSAKPVARSQWIDGVRNLADQIDPAV